MTKAIPTPGNPIKLNKTHVDQIVTPGSYPDTELTGFRLWVGKSGTKSYQMYGKVKGEARPVFVTIGKHGDPWTPDSARKQAESIRLLMKQGVNPNKKQKEQRAQEESTREEQTQKEKTRELTLRIAFEEFLAKKQKASTIKEYKLVFEKHLGDGSGKVASAPKVYGVSLLDIPLVDLTKEIVLKRYDEICKFSPSSAAHALRILRGVYNTAQINHSDTIPELAKLNPVKILSHGRKGWNKVEQRNDFIADADLPAFYNAIMKLDSDTPRDYLMVCILTGMRKSEVCTLRWDRNIDLRKGTITVHSDQAKNHQQHILVMSRYLKNLFTRRWQVRDSEYVFPGRSAAGHFNDPEKPIKKVIQLAGIDEFSSHSLRRTFATAADALGYSLHEVQRLLNHKPGTVTERHYIQNVAERTREPMQKINDHLLKLMGVKYVEMEADNVLAFAQ